MSQGDIIELSKPYIIRGTLGEGGFSKVYSVREKEGTTRAIKKIIPDRDSNGISCLFEASVMASYQHPNLNHAVSIEILNDTLYIVQDQALGTLWRWRADKSIDDVMLAHIINHLAQGLKFLHDNGMIHGDVKASNVLVFPDGESIILKLSDFNLTSFATWESHLPVCTSSYRPLEAWSGRERSWNEMIDIWGLGCIAYYVKYGHTLFHSQEKEDLPDHRGRYLNALYDWEKKWYIQAGGLPAPELGLRPRASSRRGLGEARKYYSLNYKSPNIIESIFNNEELNVLIVVMLCPYPDGRPDAKEILSNRLIKQRRFIPEHGSFRRLVPLQATVIPPLVKKPKNIVVVDYLNNGEEFLEYYTDDPIIAEQAAHIHGRAKISLASHSSSIDHHSLKTACIWMAAKMVHRTSRCDDVPMVDPPVSLAVLCRLEKDICRSVKFRLH